MTVTIIVIFETVIEKFGKHKRSRLFRIVYNTKHQFHNISDVSAFVNVRKTPCIILVCNNRN